ncbi:MAG: hypothetical protein IH874_09590 [Candidatus Dadabacteria bacterium]|nr:hypothetical protein [Candidatus Dadabacteria bacterium]
MSDVRCGECKAILDEVVGLPMEERLPCPNCGSMKRLYSQVCEGKSDSHSNLRIRGRRGGVREWFVEIITGTDWSTRSQRFMRKLRVIDREKDLYEESVVDPQSGRVVHNTKERLSKHTDHGSAKGKKST